MISDAIIVGILAFCGTAISSWLSNRKTEALLEYRLKELEKKVDLHNKVIERTYNLEKKSAVLEEKINEIEHDVKEIGKKVA